MTHLRRHPAAGVSLLEVLLAMSVLAVGLLAVTEALRASLAGLRASERRGVAMSLAATKLDEVRAAVRSGAIEARSGSVALVGRTYVWSAHVAHERSLPATLPVLYRVEVRVGWAEAGREQALELWSEALGQDRSRPPTPGTQPPASGRSEEPAG